MRSTFPATTQNTTVTIPAGVAFATVREIVAQMQAEQPEHRARIGRAVGVLLTSEIVATPELGRFIVQSCEDGTTYYTATTWACTCPDRQRNASPCKHSYALSVLSVASAHAAYDRAQARYLLTRKGEEAVAARA
jgi:hypothetical protein